MIARMRLPGLLWLALVLLGLLSLLSGRTGVAWPGQLLGGSAEERELGRLILFELRLPRTLLGLLVGATLGLCGAALQGLTRNPLAEPGLLGVSSGAALGAVIAIYSGLGFAWPLAVPLAGLASWSRARRWRSISRRIPSLRGRSPNGCSVRWPTAAGAR